MKNYIYKRGFDRIILLFAGWAMDNRPFRLVDVEGYDLGIVWDYTESSLEISEITGYKEIIVAGWSMGVIAAEKFIAENRQLPITKTIAIAGCQQPRHDLLGIPEAIYDATLEGNSDAALHRFYRRVAGGGVAAAKLMPELPQRRVAEAQAELRAITERLPEVAQEFKAERFDEVILGGRDLIFPVENLQRAWADIAERVTVEPQMSHLPDFNELLRRIIINKSAVKRQFSGARDTYDEAAEIQTNVARGLADGFAPGRGLDILEIGAGSGLLTGYLQERIADSRITTLDLTPTVIAERNGNRISTIEGDAELTIRELRAESFDRVVSASTIQWFNSPSRFLEQVARVLRSGGEARIATFGPKTLSTIREIAPEGALHYAPIYLPENVEGTVTSEIKTVAFNTATEALRHLQLTGVNGSRRGLSSVKTIKEIKRAITDEATGMAKLTFEVVTIIFKKK